MVGWRFGGRLRHPRTTSPTATQRKELVNVPGPSTISSLSTLMAKRQAVPSAVFRFATALAVVVVTVLTGSAPAAAAGEISIEKLVNNATADSAPGPTVNTGATVKLTYRITVNDPDGLYDIQVLDSSGVVPNCDTNGDGKPDGSNVHQGPVGGGQSFICTATQTAGAAGSTVSSSGIAKATDFFGTSTFESSDPANFTVRQPVTTTAAPTTTTTRPTTVRPTTRPTTTRPATAQSVPQADAVTTAAAPAGQNATGSNDETAPNQSLADGATTDEAGQNDTTADEAANVKLAVESMVNGHDADQSPGPDFEHDETIRWTHLIVNASETSLANVVVTDSAQSDLFCRLDGQDYDSGDLAMPFDLDPGQSVLCESVVTPTDSDGPTVVAALVTVEAETDDDSRTSLTTSDPVHYTVLAPSNDPDTPAELAFTEGDLDEGQSALRIPWVLVPGLIALVAGAFFLLGLVRRPEEI